MHIDAGLKANQVGPWLEVMLVPPGRRITPASHSDVSSLTGEIPDVLIAGGEAPWSAAFRLIVDLQPEQGLRRRGFYSPSQARSRWSPLATRTSSSPPPCRFPP